MQTKEVWHEYGITSIAIHKSRTLIVEKVNYKPIVKDTNTTQLYTSRGYHKLTQ